MLGAHAIEVSPVLLLLLDAGLFLLIVGLLWRLELRLPAGREYALLGIIATVGIAGRVLLEPLPNVQPVTILLFLVGAQLGWRRGVLLAIVITLVSNLFLGHGIWTLYQVVGWSLVAWGGWKLSTWLIDAEGVLDTRRLVVIGLLGALAFDWLVSLSVLHTQNFDYLLRYILNGLPYDLYHVAGNVFFAAWLAHPAHLALRRHFGSDHQNSAPTSTSVEAPGPLSV
jgi:energy-coupling factor transport system substrate-specific component